MFRTMLRGAVLLSGLVLALPASAVTINMSVADGGIDSPLTRTCSTSACNTSATIWSLANGEQYAATGTISIDTTLSQMTVSLAVASSVIDADPALGQAGSDLGATSLAFTGGTYNATLAITDNGGGNYVINPLQNAALAFTLVQAVGAGAGGPVALGAVRVTGSCQVSLAGAGQCGLTFGASGTTPFRVNGTGFGTYDRFVRQTFNVTMVPEPTTLLLLGFGLAALAVRVRH